MVLFRLVRHLFSGWRGKVEDGIKMENTRQLMIETKVSSLKKDTPVVVLNDIATVDQALKVRTRIAFQRLCD